MSIELLAPAGSPEVLNAAIGEGADAVYLGLKAFNARQRAKNFSYKQLEAVIEKLHAMNKKVYVTLNTIFEDWESQKIYNLLKYLSKVGPDAVIVQDFGIINIINQHFPALKIHASTQMNISSAKGINFLSRYNVSRVVLGRELSLEEIKNIRQNTNTELEIFIHGALCISVSGLCLFSSYLGGKSGNKGVCTQPCRRLYTANDKNGYFFSPRDLMLIKHIPQIIDAGINSLKIEGRLRSAEYTATVVRAYRHVIDNYQSDSEAAIKKATSILQNDFARNKTTYYFIDKDNTDFFNPKQSAGTGLYVGKIDKIILKDDERLALVKTNIELSINDTLRLHSANDTIRKSVKIKSLKTNYGEVIVNMPPEFSVNDTVYLINKKELNKKYPAIIPRSIDKYKKHPGNSLPPEIKRKSGNKKKLRALPTGLYVKVSHIKDLYITQSIKTKKIIIDFTRDNLINIKKKSLAISYQKEQFIFYLPPYFPQRDEAWIQKELKALQEMNINTFIVNNPGHLNLLKSTDATLICGPYLYTFNKYAANFFENAHCNFFIPPLENNKKNLLSTAKSIFPEKFLITVFSFPQLFQITKDISDVYDFKMITDKMNKNFYIIKEDNFSTIVPENPFSIIDKIPYLQKQGFNKFLIDFSNAGLTKSFYKSIIHHAQRREYIEGSTRFNWKDGFFRNKK